MKSLKELINTPNLCIQRTGQDGGSGYVQFGNMRAARPVSATGRRFW